ncbi:MAG: DUF1326 domain-containing protein [Acidobacteriota bacterium]
MKKTVSLVAAALAALVLIAATPDRGKKFDVTADTIEACSCPLFCSCYFGPSADEHMCEANNVYKFRPGSHYGNVDLSNQMVWVSLDLGGEWHHHPGAGMPTKWAVVTFDKGSSKDQRTAIGAILNTVFPVKWAKFETREDSISFSDGAKVAEAKLGSGLASVRLDKALGSDKATPTVVGNLQYWFSNSNDGFHLAYGTHHFDGEKKFSYEKRNGFTIAWKSSGDVKPEAGKMASR